MIKAMFVRALDAVKWVIDYESIEEITARENKARAESYARLLKVISTDGKTVDAEKLAIFMVDSLIGDSKRYFKELRA